MRTIFLSSRKSSVAARQFASLSLGPDSASRQSFPLSRIGTTISPVYSSNCGRRGFRLSNGQENLHERVADTTPVALLRKHRGHQAELKVRNGERYHDHGLVFAKQWEDLQRSRDTLADPLRANNLGQWEFRKLLKTAKVRPIKFHGLRHTCRDAALQAGVPANVVQQRLGHTKIEITRSVYAHALPSMQQDKAARLAAMLH